MMKKNTIISIIIIVLVLILVVLGILFFQSSKKATLTINVVPKDAILEINKKTYFPENGSLTLKLAPKTYGLKVSKTGYETYTQNISLEPKQEVKLNITLEVSASSKIPKDALSVLLPKLPHITDDFEIYYFDEFGKLYITIKKEPIENTKKEALNWISQQGVDKDAIPIDWFISPVLTRK